MSSITEITNLYLYGTKSTPITKISDELIRPKEVTQPVFTVDINEFMNTGGGRFALGAQFDFIQDFFTEPVSRFTKNPDFQYGNPMSKEFFAKTILGYSGYSWNMSQDRFLDGGDYAERVYIYHSMSFKVVDDAQFIIDADGHRRIENFAIIPRDDSTGDNDVNENFDFKGKGLATDIGNPTLNDAIDPSRIGRTVDIDFTGNIETSTYDSKDFLDDLSATFKFNKANFISSLSYANSAMVEVANNLWLNDGPTNFLYQQKPIVYGTIKNDSLSPEDVKGSSWADINGVPTIDDSAYEKNGVVLIGGKGNDSITGGDYSDILFGNIGNDTFIGSGGNDKIDGGKGKDVIDFSQSEAGVVINDSTRQENITVSNIESYIGSNYDDRIKGGNKGGEFYDNSGSDVLFGGKGNDTFYAGEGNDFFFGNGGNDKFIFSGNFGDDAVANFTSKNSAVIDGYDLASTVWYSIVLFGGIYWYTEDKFLKLYTDNHSVQIIDANGNSVFLENAVNNGVFFS